MLLSNPSRVSSGAYRPFTAASRHIVPLILLTSSRKAMGGYVNRHCGATVLWITGLVVIALNITLLADMARG